MLDNQVRNSRPAAPTGEILPLFGRSTRQPRAGGRVALIGNFFPRKCGIATFTTDIYQQLAAFHPEFAVDVYALDDPSAPLEYSDIAGLIARDDAQSYAAAAQRINASGADAVWLQHEYGIFGGSHGSMVCDFVDRLAAPLILTLHTVLTDPSAEQEAILRHLITRASRIMVMSHHSRRLLSDRYGAPAEILEVIEHGSPDRPFGRQEQFKHELGLSGRKVLMTFGLLGRGKGIEHVIEALPHIAARHPEVVYRIVGATHPNLVAHEGEGYRDHLRALAARLGVSDHIEWVDRFLDTDELLDQLEATDIYITPYGNLQQSTSGTLSYAVGLGKAVVSTPYVHARELLANEVGLLIEPSDAQAIATAVTGLLDDPARLAAMQRRAYAKGRETIWPRFADASARLIEQAVARAASRTVPMRAPGISAVLTMSDATGMLQHSIGIVPDRNHGYCLDDNARALMLMNLSTGIDRQERLRWSLVYASFIQHAWNPDTRAFRNFMHFERTWCEDVGSEDSNGRALWALGHTFERSVEAGLRDWAIDWFEHSLAHLPELGSPRARAFAMLGAAAVLRTRPDHPASRRLLEQHGAFLLDLLRRAATPEWPWFETVLGYDNPRLCQALIEAGEVLDEPAMIAAGLATLEWIMQVQTASSGQFRPVGSESFGREREALPFDQQPLEAQAAIEAAQSALRFTGDKRWLDAAHSAWDWFNGANDRGHSLVDQASGRCRDGLTPRGINRNSGAESILAYQLSFHALREMMADEQTPHKSHQPGADAH